jgi:hypothetical protein
MVRRSPRRCVGGQVYGLCCQMSPAKDPGFRTGVRPPGSSLFKGFEIWVLWLKRFPCDAIEAMFWGWGAGDFQIEDLTAGLHTITTQLDSRLDETADPPSGARACWSPLQRLLTCDRLALA